MEEKILGGMFGLLVGDALGVPYEFHYADELPPRKELEMQPPKGFMRSHPVSPGTWSDDGAQALCLLDSLLECGGLDIDNLARKLSDWQTKGLWAVDGFAFDVGAQTGLALSAYRGGKPAKECGLLLPNGMGNGSLMRVLPLALWHEGDDESLVLDAHAQSTITHGHPGCQACCALYCLVARLLLSGVPFEGALEGAVATLRKTYEGKGLSAHLLWLRKIVPENNFWEGKGGGYVIDCLRSAFGLVLRSKDYEDVVKSAVMLGDDTDTTACVAGGLAGILYGFSSIPKRWYDALRGKEKVMELYERMKR